MDARHLAAAAAVALTGTGAVAGGTWDSAGTITGQSDTTYHEVAEGHVLMDSLIDYQSFEMQDAENPMAGLSGPCFGAMEMVGGGLSGGGKCSMRDGDGEVLLVDWTADGLVDGNVMQGSWQPTSGTGKWDGASGGGSFTTVIDPESGASSTEITGEITLP